jgi:hypothetical protein
MSLPSCIFCDYEVPGMILLRDLEGGMGLDRSKVTFVQCCPRLMV